MALEDYNSVLITHLEELQAAAELADHEEVEIQLTSLREKQFDVDSLGRARKLYDDGQFDALLEWTGERLMELRPAENPFAGDFEFDLDDAFLDLEDTGFRQPSEQVLDADPSELLGELGDDEDSIAAIEVLEDSELTPSSVADVQVQNRPHVLSGKFNLITSGDVEQDQERRSLAESLDQVAKEARELEVLDPDRQTRPNVTPDLAAMKKAGPSAPSSDVGSDVESSSAEEEPSEPGTSQDSRAVDEDPAPPIHRIQGSSDISDEIATMPPDVGDEEVPPGGNLLRSVTDHAGVAPEEPPSDEVSIELLEEVLMESSADASDAGDRPNPSVPIDIESAAGFDFGFDEADFSSEALSSGDQEDDDFDFDLGLTNPDPPEPMTTDDPAQTKPGDVELDVVERDREFTPHRPFPAQDPEDMFFELAEALAADSSSVEQYRGEPIRAHAAETNPFGADAPTGTGHMPLLADNLSSAAQSHVQTNMNAIILEARRLRATGELEASLDITKKVLSRGPNPDAEALREQVEGELEARHRAKLGALTQTPILLVEIDHLSDLRLDHRAGYVISQVDGLMTFEDLIELSGMSRIETLAVLCQLMDQDVIGI